MKNKFYTFIFRNRSRNRSQNPQPFPKTCFFFHIFVALIKNAAMKYTTIIDIAQALGISKSTVSRALRGDKQNVSKLSV